MGRLEVLVVSVVVLVGLVRAQVNVCDDSPEFLLKISRPGCTWECYPSAEARSFVRDEIDEARRCDSTRSGSDLDDYWDQFYEDVMNETTCLEESMGRDLLCLSSTTVMRSFNAILEYCENSNIGKWPREKLNVLKCDPEHTYPFHGVDLPADLQDAPLEEPPVEDYTRCLGGGGGCSDEEIIDIRDFLEEMLLLTNQRADVKYERVDSMRDIAQEFQSRTAAAPHLRTELMRRSQDYTLRAHRSEAAAQQLEAQANSYAVQLRSLQISHSDIIRLTALAEQRRILRKQRAEAAAAAEAALEAERITLGCFQGTSACRSHRWASNVWVNDECLSVCVHAVCRNGPTFKYCLRMTTSQGYTKPTCHANFVTRKLCFKKIKPFG